MKYTVRLKPRAEKELAKLSADYGRRVAAALEKLEDGLAGDVKRLTNFTPEYRLRVGDYRVLFEVEQQSAEQASVIVYRICPRRDVCRH